MRRIRHTIRRCNADRLEREAYARLLAAVFSQELAKTPTPMVRYQDIPPALAIFVAGQMEEDPQLWN